MEIVDFALSVSIFVVGLLLGLIIRELWPKQVAVSPQLRIRDVGEIVVRGQYSLKKTSPEQLAHRIFSSLFTAHGKWHWVQSGNSLIFVRAIQQPGKKEKDYFSRLGRLKDSLPAELYVRVIESNDKGILVDAECRPTLFRKVTQAHVETTTEAIRTACQLECSGFLRDVFVGALEAKEVKSAAPSKIPSQEVWEFLVNRIDAKPLTTRITSQIQGARRDVRLLGWIDLEGFPLVNDAVDRGVRVRLVTHTPSSREESKRTAIAELIKVLGADSIRFEPSFHSRLLVVDDFVFIGGVDLTSDSLSHRTECALWTNATEVLANANALFEELFRKGTPPKGVRKSRNVGGTAPPSE